jgi:hypothetical protein
LHKCKSYYSGYKSKKNPYLTRGYGSRKARREATKICMPLQRRGHAEYIPEELGALSLEGELDGCLYIPDESSKPL